VAGRRQCSHKREVIVVHIVVYSPELLPGGGYRSPPDVNGGDPDSVQLWHDPDDGTDVGLTSRRPGLDAAGLLARAQDIHARYPMTDPSTGSPYTDAALEQAVTDWITAAGA
jgi:hypothetical protein